MKNDHKATERLSLFFFVIFFALIIVGQFYINDRLLGFAMGMGMASLFCHGVAIKLEEENKEE